MQLTERDVTPRGSTSRRTVVEVLVRKVPESQEFIEIRFPHTFSSFHTVVIDV